MRSRDYAFALPLLLALFLIAVFVGGRIEQYDESVKTTEIAV